MEKNIYRGQIYYAVLDPVNGSEQGGHRPVVILQNDGGNKTSNTTIVAPLTTNLEKKNTQPTHIFLKKRGYYLEDSIILIEQLRTIDKSRIQYDGYLGRCTKEELIKIDRAIQEELSIGDYRRNSISPNYSLEELQNISFLSKEAVAFAVVTYHNLKHSGNIEITLNDFGEYMIMLMQKFSSKDIEEQAKKILKDEIKKTDN